MDPDTDDQHLVYEITEGPKHGYVESKLQPGKAAATFTQGGDSGHREMGEVCSNFLEIVWSFSQPLLATYPPVT